MSIPHIHGHVEPGFLAVRQAFLENFVHRGEIGAGVSVFLDGRCIVNLWAGRSHWFSPRRWEEDTLVNLYSGSKGLTAICLLRLVDQGRVDLDMPVAHYWPAFGRHGKEDIPVRWVLCHKAAVTGVRRPMAGGDLYRWRRMAGALANEAPWWEPGQGHGYHAVSFGWILGEVVKAVTGLTVGQYLRREIARPLGLDLHIGLDPLREKRVATMMLPLEIPESPHTWNLLGECVRDPLGPSTRALLNPLTIATGVNSRQWRRAELPAANAHGTAHGLAKVYGCLARGGSLDNYTLIDERSLSLATEEAASGHDYVLQLPTRFSMGFMLNQSHREGRFGPGQRSFGHNGAGGSFAFADPDRRVGFGYVMNRMGSRLLLDPRAQHLIDALYRCL